MTNKREYEKYEFCKAVNCTAIKNHSDCRVDPSICRYTAKEFHKWLIEQGAVILMPCDGGDE